MGLTEQDLTTGLNEELSQSDKTAHTTTKQEWQNIFLNQRLG